MVHSTIVASLDQTHADLWGYTTQVSGQELTLISRRSSPHPTVRNGKKTPYLVESLPGIALQRLPHSLVLYSTLGLGRP